MSNRNQTILIPVVLACSVFLFFAPSLKLPFYGDDFAIIKNLYDLQQGNQLVAQVISDFGSTWFNGGGNFYRPLVIVSYALDLTVWGSQSWGLHLTNILLHSLNAIMVFFIVDWILRQANARWSTLIAVGAALFFGLRPIVGEVVFWISGRGDSLALLGMLVAFYAYLRSKRAWNRWMVLALISFAVALGCKEPAATFPVLIGAWELATYLAASHRVPVKRLISESTKLLLPFVIMVVGYLLLRRLIFGSFLQVYPPELVAPVELTNWIWWLAKVSTFHYFIGPQLSTSLWVKAQNYLLVALVIGGFIFSFRFRVTRLLWGFGAIWFGAVLLVSSQQLYVTPFGEGERLLYIFLFPFTLMVISPLGTAGTDTNSPFVSIGNWIASVGAGVLVLVLMISVPWTGSRLEKWQIIGTQINTVLSEIPQQAQEVPAGQTRILVLPGTIDGIYFARNAQGPMMSPPFQAQNWYGPILVYASERPCHVTTVPLSTPISDYRCWNVQEQSFDPFDPATYTPDAYPVFWLLDSIP